MFEVIFVLAVFGVIVGMATYFTGVMRAHAKQAEFEAAAELRAAELQTEAMQWYIGARCGASAEREPKAVMENGVTEPTQYYRINYDDGIPKLEVAFFVEGYTAAQHQILARLWGASIRRSPYHANCTVIPFLPGGCIGVPRELLFLPVKTIFLRAQDKRRKFLKSAVGDDEDC